MNTYLAILGLWLFCGILYILMISFFTKSTIEPLKYYLIILQKFIDRNNGEFKDHSLYETNSKQNISIPEPKKDQNKILFYIFLYLKLLLFYWIFYLIIIVVGKTLVLIIPSLKD